ncbi:FAD-dependent monooxygenase [Saccharothrix australiensis]|uniref:2-polyprenyl-6-methoxyphenol hydroxylase-like FAD-dependent oxidoreductase n=1 Tax=Saccharothrix australiensis TaxID=2072 RepID=A0A495W1Q5_9PSEU|nr:FAD-dependent monooxygenase [Saccharothrix australiensis]RKT55621.1 2-polyprenyl-6-methoxyphenol hydroxylase-like FAD-dependent oxidoreductase [Saccharothrix australiensis]
MAQEHVPVLIVGGGTVGLATGVALARQGVQALVVERRDEPSIHPRATGVQPPAREFFRAMGLEEAMREASRALAPSMSKINVSPSLVSADLAEVPRFPTPPEAVLETTRRISPTDIGPCSQDQIDRMLVAASAERGVEVRFNAEFESLEQDADGVTAVVRDTATGERRTIRARYLVGTDGASSKVREAVGFTMSGLPKLGDPMINMLFEADLEDVVRGNEFAFCEVRGDGFEGLLLTIDNRKRWVFHVTIDDSKESLADYPVERCQELIRKAVGIPDLEVRILRRLQWQMSSLVADNLRKGRVLIGGDAAHTIPPVSAFGMSTGISDAYNLAWKLGMVLNGQAGEGLLDTYEQERLPIARFTCEQAKLRFRYMELHWDNSPEAEKEKAQLKIAAPLVTGFGFQYTDGAIVGARAELPSIEDVEANLDGSPGSRVPHAWVERKGERVSTLDLAGSGFAVLAGAEGQGWVAAAEAVAEATGLPLTAHRIGPGAEVDDPDGTFAALAGITPTGALLVRPDNFVAWRSPSGHADHRALLTELVTTLLRRG